jgi:hypothetical protein
MSPRFLLLVPACLVACLHRADRIGFYGTYDDLRFTSEDGSCYPGGRPVTTGDEPAPYISLTVSQASDTDTGGTLQIGSAGGSPGCSVPLRFVTNTDAVADTFDGCAAFLKLPAPNGLSRGEVYLSANGVTGVQRPVLVVTWTNVKGASCSTEDSWTPL